LIQIVPTTPKKNVFVKKKINHDSKGFTTNAIVHLKKKDMHNTTNFVIYFFGPKLYGNFVFLV
jgi:hypothetical protein